MEYVTNACSLQMLQDPGKCMLNIHEISEKKFHDRSRLAYSCVGHKDLAAILDVEYNRESIKCKPSDTFLVAQLWGGRLPEGATELPEDVLLRYYYVEVIGKEL